MRQLTREMLEGLPGDPTRGQVLLRWKAGPQTWTGVPVSTVAALAHPTPEAKDLRFDSFDLERRLGFWPARRQTILAYAWNYWAADDELCATRFIPDQSWVTSSRKMTAMTFTVSGRAATGRDQGYPWFWRSVGGEAERRGVMNCSQELIRCFLFRT